MSLRASYCNNNNRYLENREECSYMNEPLTRDDGVTVADISSDSRPPQSEANPSYSLQLRCMKTVALTISTFGDGAQMPLIGTTIIHLSVLFNQPLVALSAASTCETISAFVGMISMSLVIDRLEFEFVVALTTFVIGLTHVFMLITGFKGFFAIVIVRGLAQGCYILVASLYMVDTWYGTRFRDMAVQLASTASAVGATVAPFVISLFLADLPSDSIQATNSSTIDSVTNNQVAQSTTPLSTVNAVVTSAIMNTTTDTVDRRQISDVRFSYAILGLATIACSLPPVLVYCYGGLRRPCLRSTRQTTGKVAITENRSAHGTVPVTSSRKRKVGYVSLIIAIGFVDAIVLFAPSAFLTPFALKQLKWSASDSALIMSVFYGATCVAHVIGVLLALILSPGKMLAGNIVLTAVGQAAFLGVTSTTAAMKAPVVVWSLAAVIALGQSTLPSSLLLLLYNDCTTISMTTTTAAESAGANVSSALSTLVLGYLFDEVNPFWIIYIPLIGLVVLSLLLFVRQLVSMTSPERSSRGTLSEKTVGDDFDTTVDNVSTSQTNVDEKTRLLAAQQSTTKTK